MVDELSCLDVVIGLRDLGHVISLHPVLADVVGVADALEVAFPDSGKTGLPLVDRGFD